VAQHDVGRLVETEEGIHRFRIRLVERRIQAGIEDLARRALAGGEGERARLPCGLRAVAPPAGALHRDDVIRTDLGAERAGGVHRLGGRSLEEHADLLSFRRQQHPQVGQVPD
jgi:hypothetical protein